MIAGDFFYGFRETTFSFGGNESSFLTFKLISHESYAMLELFGKKKMLL